MEIQPEAKAKPIYLIDLDTSAPYDRKRKPPGNIIFLLKPSQNTKNAFYSLHHFGDKLNIFSLQLTG